MTDNGTTAEPVETATDAPEAALVPEQTDAAVDAPNAGEAAKYRRRLRDAEKVAESLTEQLSGARTALLAEKIQYTGVSLDALTAAGHTADALMNDAGAIDPVKLGAALKDTRGRFGIPGEMYIPAEGGMPTNSKPHGTWQDALRTY